MRCEALSLLIHQQKHRRPGKFRASHDPTYGFLRRELLGPSAMGEGPGTGLQSIANFTPVSRRCQASQCEFTFACALHPLQIEELVRRHVELSDSPPPRPSTVNSISFDAYDLLTACSGAVLRLRSFLPRNENQVLSAGVLSRLPAMSKRHHGNGGCSVVSSMGLIDSQW